MPLKGVSHAGCILLLARSRASAACSHVRCCRGQGTPATWSVTTPWLSSPTQRATTPPSSSIYHSKSVTAPSRSPRTTQTSVSSSSLCFRRVPLRLASLSPPSDLSSVPDPHLPDGPRRILPGMVTHTDEMIGDVIAALKSHGRWDDLLILFSAGANPPVLFVLATCRWPLALMLCLVLPFSEPGVRWLGQTTAGLATRDGPRRSDGIRTSSSETTHVRACIILHPLTGLQSLMPEVRCRQTAARSTRCGRAVCTSPAGSTVDWCRRTHAARRAERWCMSPIGPQPSTMS